MKKLHLSILLFLSVCPIASSVQADLLIYDNSNNITQSFTPGAFTEVLDYGTSPGGKVTRFRYVLNSGINPLDNHWIRFYTGTKYLEIGEKIKTFELVAPSSGGLFKWYEYIIPEEEQFILPAGEFGYSFEFSSSACKIALASGGTGSDSYFFLPSDWPNEYYTFSEDLSFSIQLYTTPEPTTLLLLGLGGLLIRKHK